MHLPERLDDKMMQAVLDFDQGVQEPVVRYYLTYLTRVACQCLQPRYCAVVNPYFMYSAVMLDIDGTPPRCSAVPVLLGCNDNFESLLVPICLDLHYTLIYWTRSTKRMVFYDPLQCEKDQPYPRAFYLSAIHALIAELRSRNYDVGEGDKAV